MTRKKFDLSDKTLKNHQRVIVDEFTDAVLSQLGISENTFLSVDSAGIPVVETDRIPDGIKESTVEKAIADNHPRLK